MTASLVPDSAIAHEQALQSHRLAIACAGLHLLICGLIGITNGTLLLCLLVGVPAAVIPALIASRYPCSLASRLCMAAGFIGFTALTIQQTGGEVDAHFSFFVMMPVLLVYHDWRPLVLGAGLMVLHHLIFNEWQPVEHGAVHESHGEAAWLHTLLHLVAVLGQTAALCYVAVILSQRFRLESENTELARSLRHVSNEASRDALTGLFNRRHLAKLMRSLQPLVAEGVETMTLLSIDIDHFKRINDRYGHPVGDEVLRAIGQTLATCVGRDDCAVRCGGEEFLVLLRGCDLARATAFGEALRARIANSPVATGAGPIWLTISVGIAPWKEGDLFQAVYRSADEALYAAKGAGRNRVMVMDGLDLGERRVRTAA